MSKVNIALEIFKNLTRFGASLGVVPGLDGGEAVVAGFLGCWRWVDVVDGGDGRRSQGSYAWGKRRDAGRRGEFSRDNIRIRIRIRIGLGGKVDGVGLIEVSLDFPVPQFIARVKLCMAPDYHTYLFDNTEIGEGDSFEDIVMFG